MMKTAIYNTQIHPDTDKHNTRNTTEYSIVSGMMNALWHLIELKIRLLVEKNRCAHKHFTIHRIWIMSKVLAMACLPIIFSKWAVSTSLISFNLLISLMNSKHKTLQVWWMRHTFGNINLGYDKYNVNALHETTFFCFCFFFLTFHSFFQWLNEMLNVCILIIIVNFFVLTGERIWRCIIGCIAWYWFLWGFRRRQHTQPIQSIWTSIKRLKRATGQTTEIFRQ